MDAARFDRLARSLTDPTSRRTLVGVALLYALATTTPSLAAVKKGKSKKKKKKKKPAQVSPAPLSPPPPAPTCTDGIRNGSETDVDCGGSCPRCPNFKVCATRNDCASARCVTGSCLECTDTVQCPDDADGKCICVVTVGMGNVCSKQTPAGPFASCASCAAGTNCDGNGDTGFFCYRPCGAV